MTTPNSCAFLLLGGMMHLLPVFVPGAFPAGSLDGANTSALWLQLMGGVNGGIGAVYLIRLEAVPFIARVLAWRPALPPAMEIESARLLRPAMEFYEEIEEEIGSVARGSARRVA